MSFWIFIATSHLEVNLTGSEIFRQRMEDKFWGLGAGTPNRRGLKKGDRVVFYVGNPSMSFDGIATLASDSYSLSPEQQASVSRGLDFYRSDFGVDLVDVEAWQMPHPAKDAVPLLHFIENKRAWGTYLQGGVRAISEEDFQVIVGNRQPELVDQLLAAKDMESQSEFALENHLEDFIFSNWSSIDFRSQLQLYQVDGQNGRQFPAGSWSIDFLCTDSQTKDFVVVELKRGKSSDAAVGQILRYMTWVKENLAGPGQMVRGVVIAHDADDSLKYAVKALSDVVVLTYQVSFRLSSP